MTTDLMERPDAPAPLATMPEPTQARAEQVLLSCNVDTPLDTIAEMNLAVDGFLAYARAVGAQRDKFMRELLEARGRVKRKKPGEENDLDDLALVVGATLYTVEHPEKVKCPPEKRGAAMRGIEDACDGDLETVESLYSSDWFKQGAIRKVLKVKLGDEAGEKRFRELFVVTREPKLDKEGNASPKQLQKMDLNYLSR